VAARRNLISTASQLRQSP